MRQQETKGHVKNRMHIQKNYSTGQEWQKRYRRIDDEMKCHNTGDLGNMGRKSVNSKRDKKGK